MVTRIGVTGSDHEESEKRRKGEEKEKEEKEEGEIRSPLDMMDQEHMPE